MIITVTLNPAIDQTLVLDRLATGFAPGSLGRFVEHSLLELGILCDFVHTRGQTRTNLTVVDEASHETTLLSYRGPEMDPRHVQTLETRLRRYISAGDWLVVAGSIPPPLEPWVYARLIELGRQRGAHTVLDADADALAAGLSGRPQIVKSNHHEAERLLGRELDTDESLVDAADAMRQAGADTAVVTAGSRGAVAVSEGDAWRAWPPPAVVVSAVGAGDALPGGMLYKLEEGGSLEEGLRWGTAAGAAACLSPGTQLCRKSELLRLLPEVRVEQIRRAPAPAASS